MRASSLRVLVLGSLMTLGATALAAESPREPPPPAQAAGVPARVAQWVKDLNSERFVERGVGDGETDRGRCGPRAAAGRGPPGQ